MFSSLSTFSFLTPLALALSALAVPILLFYMLRLRRTETPISSTLLWRQLVRDREANAPWQRLRLSLLLLLQLLILAALVFALARPFVRVKTITTGRIVLLLDASASMKATDVSPSRFAAAREIGLDMVDTLGPDDTMTVIRVSAVPDVLAAASRDKLVLRQAIRSAEPGDVSADWMAAMTLAAAGTVGVDQLKVVIVTDGGLPPNLPSVPGDVRFVPVGRYGSNLAISALAIGSLPGQAPQLFARVTNYGNQDADVIVDIKLNGSDVIYWAYRYAVPAQGYVDLSEVELPDDFDTLMAELTLPSNSAVPDYLAVDDVAYAVHDRSGAGQVLLVTQDNIFLQQIFRSLRGVQLFTLDPRVSLPQQEFDLYVFDGILPDPLPKGDLLLVNPPTGTGFFQIGDLIDAAGPITVSQDDPRTQNLEPYISTVNLQKLRVLSGVSWGTVLMQVGDHPLVVAGEQGDRQVAILAFDARYPNTDLVLQPAWPILIAELADWFSPPRITDVTESLRPGAPVTIRLIEGADRAEVIRPNGQRVTFNPESSTMVFADTLQTGLYQVDLEKGGHLLRSESFAVNLFDPAESRIAPVKSMTLGSATIAPDTREETGQREFWPWLVGIGLAVLCLEWWVYHRSLRRIPRFTGWRGEKRPTATDRLRAFFTRRFRRKARPVRTRS